MRGLFQHIFLIGVLFLSSSMIFAQNSKKPNLGRTRIVDMLELPAYSKGKYQESFVIKFRYTVSFNSKNRIPNWVAWVQNKSHYQGTKVARSPFNNDEFLPSCPTHGEYNQQFTKGQYVRGHMCPREASMWNEDARRCADTMSNICPQTSTINGNGGSWRKIENACKEWTDNNFTELYIVCGPILSSIWTWLPTTPEIAVPQKYFKAILGKKDNGSFSGIAYVFDNDLVGKAHYMTIDQVEELTGYDLFHNLEDSIERGVEGTIDESAFNNCTRNGTITRRY